MVLMILDEVPPKDAHQLMMRIYEYMQKENRVPTTNSIIYSSENIDDNFRDAIQWLTSRELIYKNSNRETNPGAIYPAIPRYIYLMNLLTILEMDFLFESPLLNVIWERDSPIC